LDHKGFKAKTKELPVTPLWWEEEFPETGLKFLPEVLSSGSF
jgi:hypothetical protein